MNAKNLRSPWRSSGGSCGATRGAQAPSLKTRSGNYARRDHPFAAPIFAPLDTLQEGCIAAPGLIAAIVVAKFCDHLPLYRQEQIFATWHDVQIPRQTMAQWMGLATD